MNYRHIYHAGNFADIFKHLVLTLVLDYLQKKDKGLFVLDAFAGCGIYALRSEAAQKTLEYESGIGAFMQVGFANSDLAEFQSLLNPYWTDSLYPGSPLLIAGKLRPQDRLLANELHPDDARSLKATLAAYETVKILTMDAYESIRAHIPPPERRGLVLIDPPFERKDEFAVLARQMEEWIRRWATGCYMIWYPLKADSPSHMLFDAAQELNVKRVWIGEFMLHPRNQPDSFNGCGVMILNTPYQIPDRIGSLASSLSAALHGFEIASQWLTED